MNQKLIAEIGKSQRLQILNKLKRTQGLSVTELAGKIGMSYMGIKQHCIELQKGGYLDTWRRPKPVGRPEMLYRLTQRAHELFPVASNEMTIGLLESALKLFGASAAEKLLFNVFQRKADGYIAKLKGDTTEAKLASFVKQRDQEGHMAELEKDESGFRIVEHHSPILDLLRAFPIVARLETEMIQRVLKMPVQREEQAISGLYQCTFRMDVRTPVRDLHPEFEKIVIPRERKEPLTKKEPVKEAEPVYAMEPEPELVQAMEPGPKVETLPKVEPVRQVEAPKVQPRPRPQPARQVEFTGELF